MLACSRDRSWAMINNVARLQARGDRLADIHLPIDDDAIDRRANDAAIEIGARWRRLARAPGNRSAAVSRAARCCGINCSEAKPRCCSST